MKYYLLIALISLGICSQYTPIDKSYNGLTRGTSDVIHIEAFYCLLCPGSKESYFQLKQVYDALGPSKFTYTIHQFPLPYHKNAFTLTSGYRYIQNLDANAAIEYAELIFNKQAEFTDSATLGKTQNEVNTIITNYVDQLLVPKYNVIKIADFTKSLQPGTPENIKARFSWKYATHRNIVGTPMFLVNNVHLDGAEEWDALRWTDYIKAKNAVKTDI